jgi:adhesin/invasin
VKRSLILILSLSLTACPESNHNPPDAGPGAADPHKSTVVVDPATPVIANNGSNATVITTVKSADGTPLSGLQVDIALSRPDGGQEVSTVMTQSDGTASRMFGRGTVEVDTVTATVQGTPPVELADHPTITFIAGPAYGVHLLNQPPATVKAGENITPGLQVMTVDENGNPSSSPSLMVSVRLVHNSSNGVLTGGDPVATVDGGVSFDMLQIDKPQSGYSLRAEVNSGPGAGAADETQLFDVVVGDPSQLTSTLIANPVNVIADGVAQTTLTVTLRDLGNNPIPAQAIALSVSGTGNTLGVDGGVSDTSGVFTTTLSSTVPEMKTVTANAAGVAIQTQVTFIP